MVAFGIGKLEKLLSGENGATSIEYGLIAGFIGIAIIGGLQLLPPVLNAIFLAAAAGLGISN